MRIPSYVVPGVLHRYDPENGAIPVLVDVSRSGREYPIDFRSPVPFSTLHDNVSMYVDELFSAAQGLGATMLYACFPNTYIDTNRSATDIDETLIEGKWPGPITKSDFTERGLGLLKRLSRYGEPMQERKLTIEELKARLENFHEPYHQELARILKELHAWCNFAVQISCHCMSAIGAPTHADPGKSRADFNLGSCHGTTCSEELMTFAADTFKKLGHSVSINFPYYGGELIRRHSAPKEGIEGLFIEVNKGLFIDTKTFKRTSGFGPLKTSIDAFLEQIAEYARTRMKTTGAKAKQIAWPAPSALG